MLQLYDMGLLTHLGFGFGFGLLPLASMTARRTAASNAAFNRFISIHFCNSVLECLCPAENCLSPTIKQEHFDQLFSEFGQIFGQTLLFKNNTCASFFKVHYSETITGMYCHFLLPCISKLQFMKEKSSKTSQWGFCKWLLSLRRSSC